MATGVRKTTPFGTFPELSLDYLESVERVVTNFLCTWYHAFPAWRRPKHCTQNLSDLQAHLEKFYEHEYHFNETQILLAAIKRWGQQRHSDAILDWLHAEFLLRVQEAARHYSTASSEVALLSEKITRLMEELEKSTLAPSYDYNSRAKHDAPVIIQTFPDDGLDTPMYRVREPAQEVQDRNEQKFYQLYTVATEHAAKIDVLEQKVSILLSNASTPSVKASIPVRAEKEQEPSGGLVQKLEENPQQCRNLQDFLQKVDQAGYTLDEFKMFQTMLAAYSNDLQPALGVIAAWLVYDVLPRLQESHARSQALEGTVDLITKRFSAFVEDISVALPEAHGMPSLTVNQMRLNCLSTALQKHKEEVGCNDNKHASQPTKEPAEAFEDTDEGGRYTVLIKRIEALEKMVQENRDSMEAHRPFAMVEESAEIARNQTMQDAVQDPSLEFATLSDASTSSTCTLTPASTVVNEPVGESSNTGRDRVSTATTLELRVFIHVDEMVTATSNGVSYVISPCSLVVRMHLNTPFKLLTDKLREKYGDQELRQKDSPLKYIFDSDTPASLNLEQDDELIYADISDRVETIDLTI
ncbi:hypothetical protein KCU95_g15690, partial [Aureobasidium melanogenum]